MDIIGKIKQIERMSDKKIDEWQSNVALLTVNVHINLLKTKYKRNKKINKFLNDVKQDVLKNVPVFLAEDTNQQQSNQQPQAPQVQTPDPCLNYRVNLFVDNSELEGAPVIMDSNYSYQNIFGKLEYENYFGTLKTDFTMLKAGLLHKANGGYIMFQARDLLTNGISYATLKKALRIKEISIENSTDQATSMAMVSLKPEPIPLDLKDSDFKNLFKIKVEWEEKAELNEENANKLARIIHDYCVQAELLHLDKYAMAKVVEYTSRMCGDQTKISTLFNDLFEVIGEASTWAKIAKSKLITANFIEKALQEQKERVKKYDELYTEMIRDNSLLISTTGSKVGELNGLTVMTVGNSTFGKPAKITVNTYTGKSGIINIEREVEMSGSTLYNGVDVGGPPSTKQNGLLSSLSEIPINQSIAVTGSVNQKGQIQPIGGVNEKIEGFYQICKMRGLDGSHGVMIPIQNVKNLQLSDEIIDSVKNGLFKIYAISTIDEGIEVLTGVPAGKKDKQGKFPKGTVNYLVYEKLKKYAEVSQIGK